MTISTVCPALSFALFRYCFFQQHSKQSAAHSDTKCKCCMWGDCRGNDDISSVVSQYYSSYWGHECPYQLYYSLLIAIRLSSGQGLLHSSAENRAGRSSVLCFLIKFSLSPTAPATLSFICSSHVFLLLSHIELYIFFCTVCIITINLIFTQKKICRFLYVEFYKA